MISKTKILIVDDYRENIEALANLIEADNVEIHSTTHPEAALELLTHHDFGLALLDVQMPIMNGFELAKLIRGVKRFRQIPIIFVTAHQQDSTVIFQGYETGAVDLLFKPLDPQVVRSKVRVFVEMHQQKQLLQSHVRELERLRIEADAANIAKSQFLANMSHEIRTPLAAVLGFADLVAKDDLTDQERVECLSSISRNGDLLLRLIDDILDLSKIEANRLELEKTPYCLKEILSDVESTLSFKAADKDVSLSFNIPQENTNYLLDPLRVKQVLLNIVGNAIKFTPKGRVTVEVQLKRIDDKRDLMHVLVKDEGVGMNEAQVHRLFQPFGQADASTKRKFGGTGLGLVISRQIALAMQGDIRLVSSLPSVGSVFEITIPLDRLTNQDVQSSAKKQKSLQAIDVKLDLSKKRILAVDDSKDNLVLLEMFLRSTGVSLTFAGNGQQAVEEVQKNKYDMILMDIQMPNMDGREATQIIRRYGYQSPIVALTAHATRLEHEKCLDSGCDDVMVKPVAKSNLIALLNKYLPIHGTNSV